MLTDEVAQLLVFKQRHGRHKQPALQIYCCKAFEDPGTSLCRRICASQAQAAPGMWFEGGKGQSTATGGAREAEAGGGEAL